MSGAELQLGPRPGRPHLSLVIPCDNAERHLHGVIVDAKRRILETVGGVAEIIRIDDGSTDGTLPFSTGTACS